MLSKTLLLTGFEPFGGRAINPSEQVVRYMEQSSLPDVRLHTAVLPVSRHEGPAALLHALEETRPDAVICLGLAAGIAAIQLERIAVNLLDFPTADNSGEQIADAPIVAGGPAAYFTTLPVRAIHNALTAAAIPAQLSLSAGSFLCNQIIYTLLHELAQRRWAIPAGFIHLPLLPEQTAGERKPLPSMHLETMVQALTLTIPIVMQAPSPVGALPETTLLANQGSLWVMKGATNDTISGNE